jgi:hypothetical protein
MYIVHKMDGSLTFFHTNQHKLWSLYTLKYSFTHMHIKLGWKLIFSLLLTFEELHCHLWCKEVVFLFFKYINNTPFQTTQKLIFLNITNPFFTCNIQHVFGPQSCHKTFNWFHGSDDIRHSQMDTSLT